LRTRHISASRGHAPPGGVLEIGSSFVGAGVRAACAKGVVDRARGEAHPAASVAARNLLVKAASGPAGPLDGKRETRRRRRRGERSGRVAGPDTEGVFDVMHSGNRIGRVPPPRGAVLANADGDHSAGVAVAPPSVGGISEGLRRLQVSAFGKFFLDQKPSFWLISFYLLFEYVRPQSLYRSLDILPWAQWTILGCAVAVIVEKKIAQRFDWSDWLLFVFSGIVLLSSWFAVDPSVSFAKIEVYLTWVLIFVLITRSLRTQDQYFVFYFLFLLFSLKMSQHASRSWMGGGMQFRSWGATGAPGWFRNSGEMAIQMTIFLPLSAYFAVALKPHLAALRRKWKYWAVWLVPGSAVMALLASSSRGGQLGGVAVLLLMLLRSRKRWKGLVATAVVGLAVFAVLPQEQRDRFSDMGDDETSQSRLYLWRMGMDVAKNHPVLGVGYENWLLYVQRNYQPFNKYHQLPHNIFVQAGAELGYVGLAGFLVLIVGTFRMNYLTRKRVKRRPDGQIPYYMALGLDAALVGFMISGSFVTVLFYPYFWINYSMTAALFKIAKNVRPTRPRPVRVMATAGIPPNRRLAEARSR